MILWRNITCNFKLNNVTPPLHSQASSSALSPALAIMILRPTGIQVPFGLFATGSHGHGGLVAAATSDWQSRLQGGPRPAAPALRVAGTCGQAWSSEFAPGRHQRSDASKGGPAACTAAAFCKPPLGLPLQSDAASRSATPERAFCIAELREATTLSLPPP